MRDGRSNNGGARPGAGRKAREVEADLQRRLKRAVKGESPKDSLDKIFARWVQDAQSDSFRVRDASRRSLAAYLYGKPVQRVLVEDDKPDDKKRVDLSKLNTEELEVLERAAEIVARARRGAGREGAP